MEKEKINHLRSQIERCNSAYRIGNPIVSDAGYDWMVSELKRLDPNNEWFSRIEPAPMTNGRKVKLPIPMKSLEKVKNMDELKQWVKSVGLKDERLVVTPKFDGISLLFDQKTNQAFSRGGSDNEGQDCTEYAAKIKDITRNELKHGIQYTFGELLFRVNDWDTYFKGRKSPKTGMPYKSPRNTVAGFINRDEPDDELAYTTFFRYGVNSEALTEFDCYDEVYRYLCQLCDQPLLKEWMYADELDESKLRKCFDEWSKEFFIDGLVIYIDDLDMWEKLGRHETTGNPKYAIAYKNPDFSPNFTTTVKEVNWKISKRGAFKPVVKMDSVNTGDCEMENPTGYNAKFIFENSIGKGAVIGVTRSGGVIPKITEVVEPAPCDVMLQQRDDLLYCPHCGKPTVWNDSKVEIMCVNKDCPGARFAQICHFYNTIKAENLGEDTLSKIFKAGYDTLRRILMMTFDELVMIDTFGGAVANAVLAANEKALKGIEITQLMHASNCFAGIGQVKAKTILAELSESDRFAFINGMLRIPDGYFKSEKFKGLSKTMQNFLLGIGPFWEFVATNHLTPLLLNEAPKSNGTKYSGMKICFTGVRDKKLELDIIANGGKIVNSVSNKTTHLIVGCKNTKSLKAQRAKLLKIPILTIEEFLSL